MKVEEKLLYAKKSEFAFQTKNAKFQASFIAAHNQAIILGGMLEAFHAFGDQLRSDILLQ